ncbi:hypothetical protein GCM10011410_10310 [Hoyosella rhizosphaerae]|uniref:Uncharacterized protein n=1 Tax=Hoyosella rhizosphaerae TaxID=1755582 RepID=A0A916XBK5_9ACTN|nr:hypothetical protein GCM10011410_10310 [Hoyosella rhizosphaerae]
MINETTLLRFLSAADGGTGTAGYRGECSHNLASDVRQTPGESSPEWWMSGIADISFHLRGANVRQRSRYSAIVWRPTLLT